MRSLQLPHIDVPWDELEDSAADMVLRARTAADYLVDAAAAWDRFRDYYHHPATQDRKSTRLNSSHWE